MDSIQLQAGESQALPQNTFTRTDNAFIGWNTEANGQGTTYTDQADFTAPDNGELAITLYAQWGPSIQDFTNTKCQSLANTGNYIVYDERDGNGYTVRYINGACWMTQNLRLSGGRTLTSADSNVTRNYTLPNSSTSGFNSYTVANMYNGADTTYGAYYNYCAASAGTVCSQTEQDASQDICPKGWELPTRTQFDAIAGNSSYSSAFSPVYSGYYSSGSLSNTGSDGYWWSATAYGSNFQYYLRYRSGSLDTSSSYKYRGRSVRCVRSS